MKNGYNETSLVNPKTGEYVYGQNGYGWYGDKGQPIGEKWRNKGGVVTPSKNPIFEYYEGAKRSFFTKHGFVA